jgi:PhoPQ-activated pathogenicity-related protein
MNDESKHDADTMKKHHDFTLKTGPAVMFDMNKILDSETLDIKLIRDEIIESQARTGMSVRFIELEFKSQNWHGFVWKHFTKIFIPSDYSGEGNIGIIGQKWQDFEDGSDRSVIPETGKGTIAEYAEGTALDLDLPIMIFAVPGEDINGMFESDFTGWAYQQMLSTGDYTWFSYYPIAKSYLRAITLMGAILDLKRLHAVLLGCSKRGLGIAIAAGVDPERVAGVMTTCYHGGNNLYMAALKFAQFGPDVGGPSEDRTGPAYIPAPDLLRSLNNPIGLTALGLYDPYIWRDQIKSSYFIVLGTNDDFFGIGSPNEMMTSFKGDKAFLAIDNITHTWVSDKHLAAWRMWLAHNFRQQAIPEVKINCEKTDHPLRVQASIESNYALKSVKLYYAFIDSSDWRFATWFSLLMVPEDGLYKADLNLKDDMKLGYYVEVEDTREGLVSSLIEFV